MWAQLGLAALKSLQDSKNNANNIASNVITQKYSPWTGAKADFSGVGQSNTMGNMMAGYGAGLMQQQQDQDRADWKSMIEKDKQDAQMADLRSAEDKWMAAGSPRASSPISRSPAAAPKASAPVSQAAPAQVAQSSLPEFLAPKSGANPWLAASQRPLMSSELAWQSPRVDPTAKNRAAIWSMIPDSLPIKHGWN